MTEILCENIYNAKLNGGGVSNSLNELFVCNPFKYILSKNVNRCPMEQWSKVE